MHRLGGPNMEVRDQLVVKLSREEKFLSLVLENVSL